MSKISDFQDRCNCVRSGVFTGCIFVGKDGRRWIKGTFSDGRYATEVFDSYNDTSLAVPWCGSVHMDAVLVQFAFSRPASIEIRSVGEYLV